MIGRHRPAPRGNMLVLLLLVIVLVVVLRIAHAPRADA